MNQSASRVPVIIPIVAVLVIGYGIQRISALGDEVATLRDELSEKESQVRGLESAVDELESAAETLSSYVGEFESENWRDVVGNVQVGTQDLEAAVEEVRSKLSNLR